MPTIPTYEGDYVAPGQVPGLQVNAPSAAQIDGGVSNMLAHVADASKQIYVQASETRAEDAANKYYDASLVLTKKVTQLQGADASPEAFQKYNEDLANLRKQYAGSLENNAYAAHKFDQFATKIDRQHTQQAEDHTFKEYGVYKATTNKVTLNRELTSYIAADGAQEDDAKAAFFRVQRDQLGESADEKVLNEAWAKTKSAALGQVAVKKMDDLGASEALVFLGERKKEMDPVEWAKLKDQAERKLDNDKADNAAFAMSSKYSIDDPNMLTGMLEESKNIKDAKTFQKFHTQIQMKQQMQHARASAIIGEAYAAYDPQMEYTASIQAKINSMPPEYIRQLDVQNRAKQPTATPEEIALAEKSKAYAYDNIVAALANGNAKLANDLHKQAMDMGLFDASTSNSLSNKIANYRAVDDKMFSTMIATQSVGIKDEIAKAEFEAVLRFKMQSKIDGLKIKGEGGQQQQIDEVLRIMDSVALELRKQDPRYVQKTPTTYGTMYRPMGQRYVEMLEDWTSGDRDRMEKASRVADYWAKVGKPIHLPELDKGLKQATEETTTKQPETPAKISAVFAHGFRLQ